ncbi:MAG: DUF397 domain-containing protein [Pseudonocardia sp.]
MPQIEQLNFQASSYSNTGGGCVEPAPHRDGVLARDSKDPQGPRLEFTHTQWAQFLDELANGRECTNGVVTTSAEKLERTYHGQAVLTCWHLHSTSTSVILHFTAREQEAFLLGIADGEFHYAETTAALTGSVT